MESTDRVKQTVLPNMGGLRPVERRPEENEKGGPAWIRGDFSCLENGDRTTGSSSVSGLQIQTETASLTLLGLQLAASP